MAEVLVKAQDNPLGANANYRWLRGHPVVVAEDGHEWGADEGLPKFVVIKFPGVPVERVQNFLNDDVDPNLGILQATVRRRYQLQWAALPAAARTKLASTGEITVRVAAYYSGAADYTWAQVKAFWHDNITNTDGALDIT